MKPVAWGRLITAMVTPFDRSMEVDTHEARALARWLVATGTEAVLVGGTTGESPTLSSAERTELLTAVLDEVGDDVPVLAGTGTNSTSDSIAHTRQAEALGADGIMLVTPYYNKPPQAGLIDHFRRIASETGLPVMLYNVPGRTSVNMLPATVEKLASVENIVAVKEAGGSLDAFSDLVSRVPPEFLVYSGDDSLTLPALSVGAHGIVSVAAHVAGPAMRQMIEAYLAGDTGRAAQVHRRLFPLFKALFMTTSPIPVKAALAMAGIDVGFTRPPLCRLTPEEQQALADAMRKTGLVEQETAATTHA
jgi:4-hydroxy-tetrahydrodipicolinate synthase